MSTIIDGNSGGVALTTITGTSTVASDRND